ncbi:unknown [Roseburia sp. CAG:309]|nr:unknown [Roseburia sp. CAG:309]
MKNQKLTYTFHNPNRIGVMEKKLEQIIIECGLEMVHKEITKTEQCKERKAQ